MQEKFITDVILGANLKAICGVVEGYAKRDCYRQLFDFVYSKPLARVLILYGLRRTGKTTLMQQVISEMNADDFNKTAFIQIARHNTLADINHDLKALKEEEYKYVFIDEVTFLSDFIEGAALFSDVFATMGMKIVLSGTDSLGFVFAADDQLFDRCFLLHTTYLPYREFERVLGIRDIDTYIQYGGTMSLFGAKSYLSGMPSPVVKQRIGAYVTTAIASNIQHSLRHYQDGGHFRSLYDVYEQGELTSAINRVVEDINHRFTIDVLTREFKSNDLGLSARNLRKDRDAPIDVLDQLDKSVVTESIRRLLAIYNKNEMAVQLTEVHVKEIQEYLSVLDVIEEVEVRDASFKNSTHQRVIISQPGLRYTQAMALIDSLMSDVVMRALPATLRNSIFDRILSEIKGRMLEDIVLLDTKKANPYKDVFVLQFPVGEFDMVVADPASESCELYEIKHSTEVSPQQYRHLVDEEKCSRVEYLYGRITGKYVLYRGITQDIDDIHYLNVERFLREL